MYVFAIALAVSGSSRPTIRSLRTLRGWHWEDITTHLSGIRALQRANHPSRPTVLEGEGFVTLEHSLDMLKELTMLAPQFVALSPLDGSVIGYTLTIDPRALRAGLASAGLHACYEPFFSMIERLEWEGAALDDSRWVMGGQCCVAAGWRRQGLMRRLYDAQAQALALEDERLLLSGTPLTSASAVVTAIDTANVPSARAHERAGFVEIGRYSYAERPSLSSRGGDVDGWSIVLRPTG